MKFKWCFWAAMGLALASCSGADDEEYSADNAAYDGPAAPQDGASNQYAQGQNQRPQAQHYQPQQVAQAQQMQHQQMQVQNVRQGQAQPARGQTSSPAGMQRLQVVDRNGFEKPMVAGTILIPAGWQGQGGVIWQMNANMSGCGKNVPHNNWTATAPDGLGMVSLLPDETWSVFRSNMPLPGMPQQCIAWVTDAKEFILSYVQRYRPNARILDYRDVTDTIGDIQAQLQPQTRDPYGNETRQWAGAGQALIAYQVNGREVRELIGTVVIFNMMRMPGVMQGEFSETLSIAAMPGFAMRMVEGQLDFQKAEHIRKSMKSNPAWQSRMAKYHAKNAKTQADSNAKIAAINRKGAADRARISSNTNSDILDMQMDSWRRQQDSSDRGQREFSETMREVETYNDPYYGGTVELDSNYDRAFQLDDGTNILTNDPSFDPYAVTGQDGQELEPTP